MNCHCCKGKYKSVFVNTFKCAECKHVYRAYKGNEIEYHKSQYRNIERRDRSEISSDGQIRPLFHEKRKDICDKRLEFVLKYVKKTDNCLDIGAGAGTYANLLASHVDSVQCTELDPSLISECIRLGFKVYDESFLDLKFESEYDLVSAWHVLEHVDNVDLFLQKCKNITKKYCIIEVPMLNALNGQGRTRKLTDPSSGVYDGHAHYFTKESFISIASRYFKIIEIKEGAQSPALFAVMEPI